MVWSLEAVTGGGGVAAAGEGGEEDDTVPVDDDVDVAVDVDAGVAVAAGSHEQCVAGQCGGMWLQSRTKDSVVRWTLDLPPPTHTHTLKLKLTALAPRVGCGGIDCVAGQRRRTRTPHELPAIVAVGPVAPSGKVHGKKEKDQPRREQRPEGDPCEGGG